MSYKPNKSTTLSGYSELNVNGTLKRILFMTASVKNEDNQSYPYSITILDPSAYAQHLTECRADIQLFLKDVFATENQMFKDIIPTTTQQ